MTTSLCSVDECGRPVHGRSLCATHLTRLRRRGNLGPPEVIRRGGWRTRHRIDAETGCWIWTGAQLKGYGRLSTRSNPSGLAHRIVYSALVGPIPDGLTLDHLCQNTLCVNPAHLEPVTASENLRRRHAAARAEG